jgi:diguanylate cyclase (GGDEF)-like protein
MGPTVSTDPAMEWLVLLEAGDVGERSTIDPSSFARLVASWATPAPTALYSPSRYALQVAVTATDAPSALSTAIWLWKDSLRRTALPEWPLVRAEIMTPQELEQELQAADWGGDGGRAPDQSCVPPGDVTADDLLRSALHDPVTGLPGRELFLDDVRRALASRTSASPSPAMLIVHLEGLEIVDGSLERSLSGEIVVETARRLTEMVRRRDTVARVGPAEFAMLVEVATGEDADCLARRIVDLFRCPPSGGDQPLAVRATVGVALSSSTDDADQLILAAEWQSRSSEGRAASATELSGPKTESI